MERLDRTTYKDEACEPLAMSTVEVLPDLLPKWSPPDGIAMPTGNKTILVDAPSFWSNLTEKATWHSRISDLVFFSLLLGIGAIFGVFATARYMANPDVIGLSSLGTNFTELAGDNRDFPSSEELSTLGLMPYPVDLSDLSDVYHDMSDAELLRVATVDGARLRRGEGASPKVAYMFLTRGPLPLAPLWERYFEGHEDLYSIFIHSHPNFLPNFRPDSVFYRRNIPSKEVRWGRLSEVAAERRLLANALLNTAAIERFVLVSESCIPVTPFPVAYRYFLESEHSFVDSFVDDTPAGIGRYYRVKHFQKLSPEISPEQWRKGSQWFEMSRELALTVVADVKYYRKFESIVCSGDNRCYADEHYIPTMLTILAPSKLANRTTMYFRFGEPEAHPYEWKTPDVTELSLRNVTTGQNCTYNGRMTDTCLLFARKFTPGTIEPLLELATASFGIP